VVQIPEYLCPICKHTVLRKEEREGRADLGYSYLCVSCGIRFRIYGGRLVSNLAILRGRLKRAEAAYPKIAEILGNIKGNRKKIVGWLRSAGCNMDESNLKGARARFPNRELLMKGFGIRIFPTTIYIRRDRWRPERFYEWAARNVEGVSVNVSDPFLGSIPINIMVMPRKPTKAHSLHEDLHGAFRVYRGKEHSIEGDILNEIFAYRAEVMAGEFTWDQVKQILMGKDYLSRYLKDMEGMEYIQNETYYKRKIDEACDKMKQLDKHQSQQEITHIILRCRGLDDLINWRAKESVRRDFSGKGLEREIDTAFEKLGSEESKQGEKALKGLLDDIKEDDRRKSAEGEEALRKMLDEIKKADREGDSEGKKALKRLLKEIKERGR
jgi:hypothetical protein